MSSKWILSATELETFETCQRKWAYQYIDGIKPPPSPAAKVGILVHKVLEKYLTGYPIDYQTAEGEIAAAGLGFLPAGVPPENIEKKIFFQEQGLTFSGTPDFFGNLGSKNWLLGDHKTCSSFSSALIPQKLKKNIQANVYARWLFSEKGAQKVRLRWIYYRTKGTPQAKCIEADLSFEENSQNWSKIFALAKRIIGLAEQQPKAEDLPKNTNSCFKYGRCPFYSSCKTDQRTATYSIENKQPLVSLCDSTKDNAMGINHKKSFHLFIDCVPTKNESPYERTMELSELLKPVLTKIQTEKELSHYRMAGYGQHVGLLANYLSEHLKKESYDNRTAILSSLKTPEGCDSLQTLTAAAGQVVRGF